MQDLCARIRSVIQNLPYNENLYQKHRTRKLQVNSGPLYLHWVKGWVLAVLVKGFKGVGSVGGYTLVLFGHWANCIVFKCLLLETSYTSSRAFSEKDR